MNQQTFQVAVVGASGYTGIELVRLLLAHPQVELAAVFSRAFADRRLGEVFPQFEGRSELKFDAS